MCPIKPLMLLRKVSSGAHPPLLLTLVMLPGRIMHTVTKKVPCTALIVLILRDITPCHVSRAGVAKGAQAGLPWLVAFGVRHKQVPLFTLGLMERRLRLSPNYPSGVGLLSLLPRECGHI